MDKNEASYTVENSGEKLEIVFSGRMDTGFSQLAKDDILQKISESNKDIQIDLAAVEYVSSAFLRLFVLAVKITGTSRKISLINVSPSVKKVFKIANFDTLFTM